MIEVSLYRNKQVAVFGLGKTGISVIRSLKLGGAIVYAWDDSPAKRQELVEQSAPEFLALNIASTLRAPETYDWSALSALILSPGIPLYFPEPHPIVSRAQKANCPILCDIELLSQTCSQAKLLGITGTNGKSTTTSLIHHIFSQAKLRSQVGGNLGIPALELEPLSQDGTYILELSSYQLDLLEKTHFNTAILLNITPDHIDRHGSLENYADAKYRIFRHQTLEDHAIIGIDSSISCQIYQRLSQELPQRTIIPISTNQQVKGGVSVINNRLYNQLPTLNNKPAEIFDLGSLKHLTGKHNGENIAAAFAACALHNIPSTKILEAIRSFPGLKHRLQYVAEIDGMSFINDSKATNAEATEKALLSFSRVFWIAGGLAKEGGIEMLKPLFSRIAHAFLIGNAENEFAETLEGNVPYTRCGTLEQAFQRAYHAAKISGESQPVILLSPACASFDQWKNFEQRGDAFCNLVKTLQEQSKK